MSQFHQDGLFFGRKVYGHWEMDASEWNHAVRVLRLRPGATLRMSDGQGAASLCRMQENQQLEWLADLPVLPQPLYPLHLAVGILHKADRFEWMVEKLAELGVSRLSPLITERAPHVRFRMDRLEKIAKSAMKQSGRHDLMHIDTPQTLPAFLGTKPKGALRFAWCAQQGSYFKWPAIQEEPPIGGIGLVGPEGDFSPKEAEQLLEAGALPMALGAVRLRSETAALLMASSWFLSQGLDDFTMQV